MPVHYDDVGLAFDLDTLLTQSAPVERDQAVQGPYGEEKESDYQVVATLPCRFTWWHSESGRSTSREWADPEATIFYAGGTLTLAPGAEIKDGDHVANILEGETIVVDGPFQVSSVQLWEDHTEAQLVRPAAE